MYSCYNIIIANSYIFKWCCKSLKQAKYKEDMGESRGVHVCAMNIIPIYDYD